MGFKGPFAAADGRVIHDAGGSEVQELAFVLTAGVAYMRAIESAGLTLVNTGTITANNLGAWLSGGGTVTNGSTAATAASITGVADGVEISGSLDLIRPHQ